MSEGSQNGLGHHPAPKHRDWKDITEIVLLTLTFVAVGVAAYFAGLAAVDTSEQVKIAQKTLVEIKSAARKELRAYVFAKPYPFINLVREGGDIHTRINHRNSGQTPASEVRLKARMALKTDPPNPSLDIFKNTEIIKVNPILDPKIDIIIGPLLRPSNKLTGEEVGEIRKKSQQLYVWGTIYYKDVFGEITHHTYFCFAYSGLTTNLQDSPNDPDSSSRIQGRCKTPRSD